MNHQTYSERAVLLLHFPEAGLQRTKMWPVMAACDSARKERKEDDPMARSIYTPPDTDNSYIFSKILSGGIYTIGDKCTGTTKQNPSSPKLTNQRDRKMENLQEEKVIFLPVLQQQQQQGESHGAWSACDHVDRSQTPPHPRLFHLHTSAALAWELPEMMALGEPASC